jgi:hypothetical protein
LVPRPIVVVLVLALPVLIVAFAVLMAGCGLAQGLRDPDGAAVLRWIALACLMLLAGDALLLLIALGMNAIDDRR